uniref:NADAR domain-containing protein n=1 Tax=Tetranychus urticae TaxID=32264 RepID=T1L1V8_TETUR
MYFDEGSLNELFGSFNIERSDIFNIDETSMFHHNYKTKNQISTLEFDYETCRLKVLTYDSAQYLYQSKRRGLLSGPEEEERVRLSSDPFAAGMVNTDNFVNKADEWYTIDIDLAFKCNWLKFKQNEHFADELLRTGRKFIVYPGTRGNKDWSDITAKILMIIREDLRRQAERKD